MTFSSKRMKLVVTPKPHRKNSNPPADTEVEWVQRAVTGDQEAFTRLYDTHVASVYRFIRLRVDESQTAEDLTAQVFFNAWRNLGRYEMRGLPFRAWLFRIARNLIIDHHRTRKETLPLDSVASRWPDGRGHEDEIVERIVLADELREALRKLTKEQRQVLILRFIEGLGTDEAAAMMGKQAGAIRALQMRGLHALAFSLQDKRQVFSQTMTALSAAKERSDE